MKKIEEAMVEELIEWLDRPEREDETVRDVSEGIVKAVFSYLARIRKEAPPTIRVGEPFKDTVTSKVHTPLWEKDDLWWIVSGDSRYGFLGKATVFAPFAAPTRAAAAKTENKDGWEVGDRVSFMRTRRVYVVLATAEKCVLLETDDGLAVAEPNDSMEKYFTKVGKQTNLL